MRCGPDRARLCRRRRHLGCRLCPRHSQTDAKPHRRRSACTASTPTRREPSPRGVQSSRETRRHRGRGEGSRDPRSCVPPAQHHGWKLHGEGSEARGRAFGGGQFRAPTFLGRVFWRLTLGGRGLGWKSRPRGQVWSERPSRGFSGALQRCAQRDGAKQRPRGTRVPFTRRIPWRVGAPRAPLSKRLINRVELL